MGERWTIENNASATKGYLRIKLDGKRVADVFPYAPDSDSAWVIAMAASLVRCANEAALYRDAPPSSSTKGEG